MPQLEVTYEQAEMLLELLDHTLDNLDMDQMVEIQNFTIIRDELETII